MENQEYNNLVINHELNKLANISVIDDLINYKYLNLYLIEYLLRENIHTSQMDNKAKYNKKWFNYYLKYDIFKPLLESSLTLLLETSTHGETLLYELLKKLTKEDKMELYHNLKANYYWSLRDHSDEVIDIYKRQGILLSNIFITRPMTTVGHVNSTKKNMELLAEFEKTFKNTNPYIIKVYLYELKKRLSLNNLRARSDIEKLIAYKKMHPKFKLTLSNNSDGTWDLVERTISISPYRYGVLTHEVSHLLYDDIDKDKVNIEEYEKLRQQIDNDVVIARIKSYLVDFHKRYENMKIAFKELYYHEIKKKYGNYNNYVKAVCLDIYRNNPEMIAIDEKATYFFVNGANIEDVVFELLVIEQEDFIEISTKNYYTEELMLENLLDALLKGKICDGLLEIECLSGHAGKDFLDDDKLSFNECLADYDMIKNSYRKARLIDILKEIVGNELVMFLDSYLEKNRTNKK